MSGDGCPDDDAVFGLLDEPEEHAEIAAHVRDCLSCAEKMARLEELYADLRERLETVSTAEIVGRVEAAIARAHPARPSRPAPRAAPRALLVGALAAAAMFLVAPRARHGTDFHARGTASEPDVARDVYVALDVVRRSPSAGAELVSASPDAVTAPGAHLLVSFATRSARSPFYLLCFALDASGEIRWLYPAFEDPLTDPSSVVLPPRRSTTPMDTEVVLDAPPGRLLVFALLTSAPLHVSDVERLPARDVDVRALSRRFGGADVRTWELTIGAAAEDGGFP